MMNQTNKKYKCKIMFLHINVQKPLICIYIFVNLAHQDEKPLFVFMFFVILLFGVWRAEAVGVDCGSGLSTAAK